MSEQTIRLINFLVGVVFMLCYSYKKYLSIFVNCTIFALIKKIELCIYKQGHIFREVAIE